MKLQVHSIASYRYRIVLDHESVGTRCTKKTPQRSAIDTRPMTVGFSLPLLLKLQFLIP
jgi:hypothetical protein